MWEHLAKLTKLRELHIRVCKWEDKENYAEDLMGNQFHLVLDAKLNVDGLISVIKSCTKLKKFEFNWLSSDGATGEEKNEFVMWLLKKHSGNHLW